MDIFPAFSASSKKRPLTVLNLFHLECSNDLKGICTFVDDILIIRASAQIIHSATVFVGVLFRHSFRVIFFLSSLAKQKSGDNFVI